MVFCMPGTVNASVLVGTYGVREFYSENVGVGFEAKISPYVESGYYKYVHFLKVEGDGYVTIRINKPVDANGSYVDGACFIKVGVTGDLRYSNGASQPPIPTYWGQVENDEAVTVFGEESYLEYKIGVSDSTLHNSYGSYVCIISCFLFYPIPFFNFEFQISNFSIHIFYIFFT